MLFASKPLSVGYLFLAMVLGAGCNWVGGAYEYEPQELQESISPEARLLIEQAYKDLDPSRLRDYHTHIVGMNTQLNGTYVNEGWQSLFKGGFHYFQLEIYKSAAAIKDVEHADEQYLARLTTLIKNLPNPGKFGIMAFDYFHDENGKPDLLSFLMAYLIFSSRPANTLTTPRRNSVKQ